MKEEGDLRLRSVTEGIDALMTVDFYGRGFLWRAYNAVREAVGQPLTYKAAKGLVSALSSGPNPCVVIGTGFLISPHMKPETDGPIGAALLARALRLGFDAFPIIVAEDGVIDCLQGACQAAGLHVYRDAKKASDLSHSVALLSIPADRSRSAQLFQELTDEYKPKAMVSIEHPGTNPLGVYHSGDGLELGSWVAPIEDLFRRIRERGGFTVGIGDIGNEIGFGGVRKQIADIIPGGAKCRCPCGGGLVSATECDAPIFANVSEIGSYALIAALSAATGRKLLQDGRLQEDVTRQAVLNGAVEGDMGRCEYAIDMLDVEYYKHIVELLQAIIDYSALTYQRSPHWLEWYDKQLGQARQTGRQQGAR